MILDMMSLNMDRHGDNVMMQTPQGGPPDLVPIDHGLTFPPPSADTLSEMAKKIGAGFNAMLAMPGSHEPFTDEMLEAIEAIDPDTMAVGLRREMALLEKHHGQTKGKLTSDAIEMSRRSTLFLKKGAAFDPPLSPAAIQVALGQYAAELLDPAVAETEFDRHADEILADVAAQQEDLKELFLMPMAQQGEMRLGLVANGWYDEFSIESWVNKNPRLALKIYKADLKEPSKMRELVALLGQNVVDRQLQTLSVAQLFDKRKQFLAVPPPNDITPQITRDAAAFTQAFPNDYGTLDNPDIVLRRAEDWRRMEALGGFASLDDALETIKASPAQAEAARRRPSDCFKVLSTAASMPLAQQAVDQIADLDARGVRRGIAYLDRVLAEVPQGHRVLTDAAQFRSNPVTGSKQQCEELRLLTIEAMDAVRADVGPRLNVVARRIETRIDNTDDEDVAEPLARQLESVGTARAAIMAGGVAGAQGIATTWEQRFPN
jgi:hypothetical protein